MGLREETTLPTEKYEYKYEQKRINEHEAHK